MKYEFVLVIIILVVVLALVWFQIFHLTNFTGSSSSSVMENLEEMNVHSKDENIDYYVITMKTPERMKNIEEQSEKLKAQGTPIQIEIVDAVVGVDLDLDELIEQKKLSPDYPIHRTEKMKKKEIGCYMSHLKIYDMIQEKNGSGYSVIFEDDFDIASEHFLQGINSSLNYLKEHNLDFDVLYLGTVTNNHGELLNTNLYKIEKKVNLYGTHAMLINNNRIDKMIDYFKFMKLPIDNQYNFLYRSDKIKAYVIYPHIVNQQWDKLGTIIGTENFIPLNNSNLRRSKLNHDSLKYYKFE